MLPDRSIFDGRIEVVDGLRGLAIASVLFYHVTASVLTPGWWTVWLGPSPIYPGTLVNNAWWGVNLFFVDSGFVLMLPYARGGRALASLADARTFWWRRAKRLLPLYYLVVVAGLVLAFVQAAPRPSVAEAASLLTLTFPASPTTFVPTSNPPLWSVGVELWFSALFPILVVLARRFGVGAVLSLALATSLSVRTYSYVTGVGVLLPFVSSVADSVLGRLDNFSIGMAIAFAHARGLPARWFRGHASTLGVLLAIVGLLVAGNLWDERSLTGAGLGGPIGGYVIVNASFGLCLLAALGAAPSSLVAKALSPRPLRVAGIGCYSLYLTHHAFLFIVDGPRLTAARVVAFVAVVATVSAATFSLIEWPMMRRARASS